MTTQAFDHKNHMAGGIKNTGQFQICSSVQSTIRRSASHEFVELSAPTCTSPPHIPEFFYFGYHRHREGERFGKSLYMGGRGYWSYLVVY